MSDVHLETTKGWDLPPRSERPAFDFFVHAGDLMPGFARGVRWLAERIDDRPVIVVAGNHEAYGRDVDREIDKAREAALGTTVIVLENESAMVGGPDGVLVLGGTGWTDFALHGTPDLSMRVAAATMNDYRRIRTNHHARRLRPLDTLLRHEKVRTFVETKLSEQKTCRRLLVTHHPLHAFAGRSHPPQRSGEKDPLDPAYMSHWPKLFDLGLDAVISGHTHVSFDIMASGVRLLANAKGHGPWREGDRPENAAFDPHFTFEL